MLSSESSAGSVYLLPRGRLLGAFMAVLKIVRWWRLPPSSGSSAVRFKCEWGWDLFTPASGSSAWGIYRCPRDCPLGSFYTVLGIVRRGRLPHPSGSSDGVTFCGSYSCNLLQVQKRKTKWMMAISVPTGGADSTHGTDPYLQVHLSMDHLFKKTAVAGSFGLVVQRVGSSFF